MKTIFRLIILLIFITIPMEIVAFEYKNFPDLTDKTLTNTIYFQEKNIYWEIFDINDDDVVDVALGYNPNAAAPVFMMTPLGMTVIWQVDIKDVPVTYYWMDLNGDGTPYDSDKFDYNELLYDPSGDGLNGNEIGWPYGGLSI